MIRFFVWFFLADIGPILDINIGSAQPYYFYSLKRRTSLRQHLSAGVQFSSALRRPAPSHCPSGCPAKVDTAFIDWLQSKWYFWQNVTAGLNKNWCVEKGRRSPAGLCEGAPPGGALQMSSLWAGIIWRGPQRRSRQRAHSYNTWSPKVETTVALLHGNTYIPWNHCNRSS